MRTVDATLTAALAAGTGKPFLKAYVGYSNGAVKASYTTLRRYVLTGTTLDIWIPSIANIASDQEMIWLERGLTIAGIDYTVTTGRFWIWEEEYLPDRVSRIRGGIVPHKYYSAAGDVDYETAIDAYFAEFGKTTTYKDDTEAWLGYQFLPAGQVIIMNQAIRFLNMLSQKRLISVCDNGAEDVRVYSADVLGSALLTIPIADEFTAFTTKQRSRQYIWKDEEESLHQDGDLEDPLHNLGYLESTDSPPARNTQTFDLTAYIRPDLRIQDGDTIRASLYGGTVTITFFALVTEEFDAHASKLPHWRLKLEANPIFHSTAGGAMPSTIERVANYTPLSTTTFDNVLDSSDNNLQAAMNTIDDHTRYRLSVARKYYVRTDGDDANSGLSNTAGGAFLTIQRAVNVAAGLDSNIYNITVKVADGNYAEQVTLKAPAGAGQLIVEGNTTTPSNIVLDGNFAAGEPHCTFVVKGFKLQRTSVASAFGALSADKDSLIRFSAMEFGTGYTWQMYATGGGKIYIDGNYTISGGAARHFFAETAGSLIRNGPGVSCTITLTGTPAWSSAMAYALTTACIIINQTQVTFSGAATGQRYNGSLNAVINSAGGGANYFPGNVAGAVATGAQYG